jgi:cell division topological specificity factor
MSILDIFKTNKGSAVVARERLLTVLVHDRVKLTPEILARLKEELSAVIARYVPEINLEDIEVRVTQGDDKTEQLVTSFPIRNR